MRFIGKSEFFEFELCEVAVEYILPDSIFKIRGVDDFVVRSDGHLVVFKDTSMEFVETYPVVGIHLLGIVASLPRPEVVSRYELGFFYACKTALATPFIEDEGTVQLLASEFVYCYSHGGAICPGSNACI